MPLGIRDWFLVIGGLMIVGVLAHGAWIYFKSRRTRVAIRYEKNIPDIDIDDIDLLRAELPSADARATAFQNDDSGDRGAGVDLDEQVPVLLDPIDQDVAAATGGSPRPSETPPAAAGDAGSGVGARKAAAGARTAPEAAPDDAMQTPLFANEPIVPRSGTTKGGGRRRRRGAVPRIRAVPAVLVRSLKVVQRAGGPDRQRAGP